MIHTVKGFSIVNKAEVDVFLVLSCFFEVPTDVSNLISGSSAFSKTSLNIWKFTVHVLLKFPYQGWKLCPLQWKCRGGFFFRGFNFIYFLFYFKLYINETCKTSCMKRVASAFSKSSLNIWKSSVHVLLKPSLENLSITLLTCEMSAL